MRLHVWSMLLLPLAGSCDRPAGPTTPARPAFEAPLLGRAGARAVVRADSSSAAAGGVTLLGVRVEFWDSAGAPRGVLSAPRAVFRPADGEVRAEGGASMRSASGAWLRARRLRYSAPGDDLTTEDRYRLSVPTPGPGVEGEGVTTAPDLRTVKAPPLIVNGFRLPGSPAPGPKPRRSRPAG